MELNGQVYALLVQLISRFLVPSGLFPKVYSNVFCPSCTFDGLESQYRKRNNHTSVLNSYLFNSMPFKERMAPFL